MEERWELLNILEFNSDRKRMSVIVRDPTSGVVRLFCKGADSVIFGSTCLHFLGCLYRTDEGCAFAERLSHGQDEMKEKTYEHLASFGGEGLRTLAFATRIIPSDEYEQWNQRYRQAALQIYGREEAVRCFTNPCRSELRKASIDGYRCRGSGKGHGAAWCYSN